MKPKYEEVMELLCQKYKSDDTPCVEDVVDFLGMFKEDLVDEQSLYKLYVSFASPDGIGAMTIKSPVRKIIDSSITEIRNEVSKKSGYQSEDIIPISFRWLDD